MAVNNYVGWYGGGLPDMISRKSWQTVYDKPMIFSEFGALHGFRGGKLTRCPEDYQYYYYMYEETIALAERTPFVRGMSPWIMKDFRSPRRWNGRF